MDFKTDIRFLKGVGEKRAELFNQLGVKSVGALLQLYPRDYRILKPIKLSETEFDTPAAIKATVISPIKQVYIRKNMVLYKFIANDGDEDMAVTIFNNKYVAESLKLGGEYLFYGKVIRNLIGSEMSAPEIYPVGTDEIIPVYPQTAGLTSKAIHRVVKTALENCIAEETLSEKIKAKYGLCDINEALHNIHCPKNQKNIETARRRLVFEELFFLQTGILFQKSSRTKTTNVKINGNCIRDFAASLPFTLTDAQKSAINDAVKDMRSGKPMSRLVQGDVGSGKTMVAAALSFAAAKEGYQSVIMAPTEVLAVQHFNTLEGLMKNSGIRLGLLVGSMTKTAKTKLKAAVENGEIDILIGTHAVLEDDVNFKSLGLVVTDEQHRFGVEQRTILSSKGNNPHMLVMSATPIPRTMSLIFYGDLDISIIDSLPSGRQPIETYFIGSSKRDRAYSFIKNQLDSGRQAYIVCPAVQENETINIKAATEYYEALKEGEFSGYSVGLLHGKMRPKEKERVMVEFKNGDIQLLISTTVIEVGVDVPNAVIMMIENAERFGLSQLHQLRGRIGRGKYKSTCILVSDFASGETGTRLKFLTKTIDGFKIADEDLRLRGPGDFLGKRQHGLPELKIADLSCDMMLFREAGAAAKELYNTDPLLESEENLAILKEMQKLFKTAKNYGYN